MDPDGHDHARVVRAIVEQVQSVGLASERIGHSFSAQQRLHPTDFRALMLIFQADQRGEPLSPRALARLLQMSPAAVTYSVDRLVASGHVRRDPHPGDRRRTLLRFAPHGREVAGAFFEPLGEAHAGALASFSAAELETALRVMAAVNDTLACFHAQLNRDEQQDGSLTETL